LGDGGYSSILDRRELVTFVLSDGFAKAPGWEDETPGQRPLCANNSH